MRLELWKHYGRMGGQSMFDEEIIDDLDGKSKLWFELCDFRHGGTDTFEIATSSN